MFERTSHRMEVVIAEYIYKLPEALYKKYATAYIKRNYMAGSM